MLERVVAANEQVEAILEAGRRTRPRTSRGMWIAAAILGGICLVGFVLLMIAEPSKKSEPAVPTTAPARSARGFATGILVGGVAGLAIGYAIARHRGSKSESDQSSGSSVSRHSSRKSP